MSVRKIIISGLLFLLGAVMGATQAWSQSTSPESVMTQNADGTWTVHKQVPLVGEGRVVNRLMSELVSLLPVGEQHLDYLVDEDLVNATSFGIGLVGADLFANELVSVKDINRVYAGGQKIGFVFESKNKGLLGLDLLKGYVIKTYLKGELQETIAVKEEDGSLLNLELLSFGGESNPTTVLSVMTEKPFDEVSFLNTGLADVDLLGEPLRINYFFVGENPEIPAVKNSPYFTNPDIHDGSLSGWTKMYDSEKIVDSDLSNGGWFSLVSGLLGACATVNFNQEVPAGYEVGFRISNAGILSLGVLNGTSLETYNAKSKKQESITFHELIGASLIGGGHHNLRFVTTKPSHQLRIDFGGLNVKLDVTTVHYAYIRKPVTVGPEAYLSLADDTIYSGDGYQFYINKKYKDKVTFRTVGTDVGSPDFAVTNDGVIHGMIKDGRYTVEATLTIGEGNEKETYIQKVTITKITRTAEQCNQFILESNYGANVTNVYDGQGCLLCVGGSFHGSASNLVDDNPNNYATVNLPLIGVADVKPIVALTLGEGQTIKPEKEGEKIRVGFTMQYSSTLLNLNALKFFYFRLYKDGKKVDESVSGENSTVGLDLIAGAHDKVRFTMTTDKEFDHIELWYAGVAGISLGNNFRIYYAFWEPDREDCRRFSPAEVCMETLNYRTGASIWHEKTGMGSLEDNTIGSVAAIVTGMGNVIDNDPYNYATANTLVDLSVGPGGFFSLGIRLDQKLVVPAGGKRQIGFIVRPVDGVLGLSALLARTTVELYNGETLIAKDQNVNGVLDLRLIGYGDKAYIEATLSAVGSLTPKYVDGMVLKLGGIKVDIGGVDQIYGAYTRLDSDGDDIPDCIKPEEELEISVQPDVINECVDVTGTKTVELTISSKNNDIEKITAVYCEFYSYDRTASTGYSINGEYSKEYYLGEVVGGKRTLTLSLKVGDYMIRFKDKDKNSYISTDVPHITIHPLETTWTPYNGSTDWNDWGNWDKGSPWTCTNVIIPSNASVYPILEGKDINGNIIMNGCNYIHFQPNTEVVRTHYLTYTEAWVEMELSPNRYYMLSAPLKEMYSGDMFISQESVYPNYFTDLTDGNYAENRTYPTIYQRLWETTALDRPLNGNNPLPVYPEKTRWTKPYNHLATLFGLQNDNSFLCAFSLLVDPEGPDTKAGDEDTYLFRFPKLHKTYNYVNEKGEPIEGKKESISRIQNNIGRFIYENPGNEGNPFPLKVRLKNNDFNNKTYLMGNPFMAHISIAEFLKINTHISSVKVYDGNINNSVVADIDDGLVSNTTGLDVIAPMQSVFIVQKDNAGVSQYCEVTFTEEMLVSKPDGKLKSNVEEKVSDRIVLIADVEGKSSTALVRLSDFASDEVVEGEDSEILLENEVSPAVALFVENEGKALDIEQRANLDKINLGFCMSHPAAVNLQVSLPLSVGDKVLEDLVNNRIYLLKAGETTSLILPEMDSQVGRFRIVDESMVKQKESVISIQYLRKSGLLEVRSFSNLLERCDVYTIDGRLVSQKSGLADCYQLDVPNGMLVVRAITENGDEKVMKLRVAN